MICLDSAPAKPLHDAQMRRGLLFLGGKIYLKPWRSIDEQIALLQNRGLVIEDVAVCRKLLMRVGYYHLSGYARYFQIDPQYGDNRFRPSTGFSEIAEMQWLDSRLRNVCVGALADVELALRTRFAYRFAEQHPTSGALWDSRNYAPSAPTATPVHELVLKDLNRAKQTFVARHREAAGNYPDLPVWVAVEVLSFGTLSRIVEQCVHPEVRKALADDLNVAQQGFSSQVRAFVTLRNACAHNNRLWNDVARSQPSVPNNILRRAKKRVGTFDPHSTSK